MKVYFMSFGCKVNQYETESLSADFTSHGFEITDSPEKAGVIIINSCTVTASGDSKSLYFLRKARKNNPNAVIVFTGCVPQAAPDIAKKIPEADIVTGTKNRNKIINSVIEFIKNRKRIININEYTRSDVFEQTVCGNFSERTRAFVKIQDGCNQFCSYCIIPYARGPIRSRKPEDVISEVIRLSKNGFQEVILAGIHVASYGKDLKNITLLEMIQKVHNIEGIKRIRFSSIEPNIVTKEFAETLSKLPKVCDHFHLSLQSGCDKTLYAMNRKYNTERYRQAVNILREYMPSVAITTDMIVGFPNESEEDFLNSYQFAKEMEFSKIHVFPYSPKRGTPAATMSGQIPNSIKNERSQKLIALSQQMTELFLSRFVGKEMEVLYEREIEQNIYEGHTTNYIKVHTKSNQNITNKMIKTSIISQKGEIVQGIVTKL